MSSIGLTPHSRIFHSYEDVTITDEGRQILNLYSTLVAIED